MRIIIVGCGRVGLNLAGKLNADGNDVTVVDMQASKVEDVTSRFDVLGIVGNGAMHTVLREAGIQTADLLIAVTNSDEMNLLCCVVAKKEGKCKTIARVKNPEYSKEVGYLKEQLGLEMVINPEYEAARKIARVLRFPAALKIERFAKGKVEIINIKLNSGNKLIGLSVQEMMAKYPSEILVGTIERGEEAFIADGNFVFAEKDIVSLIGQPKIVHDFLKRIDKQERVIKNALIVGGDIITHYLCELLENSGIALKIIEKEYKTCEELSIRWEKVDVICGKSNKELLLEEGIENTDAFVALTNFDEENILLSLFAKEFEGEKLVTKIKRTDFDTIINRLDLETVICPINIASDIILRYVRAARNARGSNVESLYNLIQDKVEVSEFLVKENSPMSGIALKELNLKKDVLIAAINRGGELILPRGNDVICANDMVVIISKHLGLQDITDVLQ